MYLQNHDKRILRLGCISCSQAGTSTPTSSRKGTPRGYKTDERGELEVWEIWGFGGGLENSLKKNVFVVVSHQWLYWSIC